MIPTAPEGRQTMSRTYTTILACAVFSVLMSPLPEPSPLPSTARVGEVLPKDKGTVSPQGTLPWL